MSVAGDGEIAITFQRMLLTNETSWVYGINDSDALWLEKLELKGEAPDGALVESTSVSVLGLNMEENH